MSALQAAGTDQKPAKRLTRGQLIWRRFLRNKTAVVGAIVTYFAPVLSGAWPAALKVAGAVIGAAIAALIPLIGGVWDASAVTIVVLAALNAFAAQTGTDARVDSAKAALVSPAVPDAAATAVDPVATKVALNQLANGS